MGILTIGAILLGTVTWTVALRSPVYGHRQLGKAETRLIPGRGVEEAAGELFDLTVSQILPLSESSSLYSVTFEIRPFTRG